MSREAGALAPERNLIRDTMAMMALHAETYARLLRYEGIDHTWVIQLERCAQALHRRLGHPAPTADRPHLRLVEDTHE
jgi:hypothetical protein